MRAQLGADQAESSQGMSAAVKGRVCLHPSASPIKPRKAAH